MRIIVLTKGMGAIVDNQDWPRLSQYRYFASKSAHTWYAVRNAYIGDRRTTVTLHRDVLQTDAPHIEHRNRNGLDCRRRNLRPADQSQNAHNRPKYTTLLRNPYKGVYLHQGKWTSSFRFRKKTYQVGTFPTAAMAAVAYNQKVREIVGEYAYQNEVPNALEVTSALADYRLDVSPRVQSKFR